MTAVVGTLIVTAFVLGVAFIVAALAVGLARAAGE